MIFIKVHSACTLSLQLEVTLNGCCVGVPHYTAGVHVHGTPDVMENQTPLQLSKWDRIVSADMLTFPLVSEIFLFNHSTNCPTGSKVMP